MVSLVLVAHVFLVSRRPDGWVQMIRDCWQTPRCLRDSSNASVDVFSSPDRQWTLVDCEFGMGIGELSFSDCEENGVKEGGSGTVYRARCGTTEYAWKVGNYEEASAKSGAHSWVQELRIVHTMMTKDAAHTVPSLAICSASGLRWKGVQRKKVIVMPWLGCFGCSDSDEESAANNSSNLQKCDKLVEGIDRQITDETRGKMRQQGARVAVALAYDRDGDPMQRLVDSDHGVEGSDNVVCSGTARDP